jgi:hypothetical protein
MCRKFSWIRSGHRVVVYNNVTQKSSKGVFLSGSFLEIAVLDTRANESICLETHLEEAWGKTLNEVRGMGAEGDAPGVMVRERVCS